MKLNLNFFIILIILQLFQLNKSFLFEKNNEKQIKKENIINNKRNKNSIVMTMMIRDEAVNIKSNLPLWSKIIDYFIFMIDERTIDDTEKSIKDILGNKIPYKILYYQFNGFGPARTLSLQNAWKYFSQATHVWIADPDWKPELNTISKDELDLVHDAFRFLIYDRNGITTRRCDWLLRHRDGLAMKYHLHEVLDIGETYSPIPIKWIVREIEQPGSWHTTVGHGHSMSAARYKFDLEMLEKDLVMYGHNPHTHHYLGITHEAYAEGLLKANKNQMTKEIEYHLNQSVTYFTKRIMEIYEPEFLEERWACMFSLGALYARYLNEPVQGLRWMKACHDFSPQQTECALSMLQIYESLGNLNQVIETLQIILKTEHQERGMLNHFKHWICDVPATAVRVYNYMYHTQPNFTITDAKYMLLTASAAQSSQCIDNGSVLPNELVVSVQKISNSFGLSTFLSKPILLCDDPELKSYIKRNKFHLHPCENLHKEFQREKYCKDFDTELLTPVETLQVKAHGEFIGAASILDIVHHCYGGRADYIYHNKNHQGFYKILFAEHFNIRNILSLILFAKQYNLESTLKITILSTKKDLESIITATTQSCLEDSSILDSIRYITWNPNIRMFDAIKNTLGKDSLFDYIEYNGGLSLSSNYKENLSDLVKLIGNNGIIGVTAFMKNTYQKDITEILSKNHNELFHIPFSQNKVKLVKEMLISYGLETFAEDETLHIALSNPNLTSFTKSKLLELFNSHHLKVISWLPTAIMNPYSLVHEQIQRYRSFGISEDGFIQSVANPFRVTAYITKQSSTLPGVANHKDPLHFKVNTIVKDRNGGLGKLFESANSFAKSSLSLTLSIPFTTRIDIKQSIIVTSHPSHLGSLSLLSSNPSLHAMLNHNKRIVGNLYTEDYIKNSLLNGLEVLFTFNYLSLWIEPNINIDNINTITSSQIKNIESSSSSSFTSSTTVKTTSPKTTTTTTTTTVSSSNDEILESGLIRRKKSNSVEKKTSSSSSSVNSNNENKISELETKTEQKNHNDELHNEIPPICQIPHLSKTAFCDSYLKKKKESNSSPLPPPPPEVSQSQSSTTNSNKPELILNNNNNNNNKNDDDDTIKRLKLKELGFTSEIIDRILLNNKEEKSMKKTGIEINNIEVKSEKPDLPSICNIPGVNSEKLCKAFEQGEKLGNKKTPLKIKRKINVPEYTPQTKDLLLSSYRNPNCEIYASSKDISLENCGIPIKFKRTTSGTTTTSRAKIKFDIAQLQYIKFKSGINTRKSLIEEAYQNMTILLEGINAVGALNWKSDDSTIVLTSNQRNYVNQINGRVLHLSEDIYFPIYTQVGAMNHISKMMEGIESMDFLVVDGVLLSNVISPLVEILLSSTYWFDISTGNTFISHSDDGLIHKAFHQIGKEFEDYLSPIDSKNPYLLSKYFAVALDQTTEYLSPIILGDSDTIHVVVWLNGNTTETLEGDDGGNIGIEVMAIDYTTCLMNHGIGINSRAHPDFATKLGSLKLGLQLRCSDQVHEFLEHKSNRVIIFGPGISFSFTSTSSTPSVNNFLDHPSEFSNRVLLPLVYVFSRHLVDES